MAKSPNTLDSVTITITTTPHVRGYLSELVTGGLYGKNVAEAAERLLAQVLDRLIEDGKLGRLKKGVSGQRRGTGGKLSA